MSTDSTTPKLPPAFDNWIDACLACLMANGTMSAFFWPGQEEAFGYIENQDAVKLAVLELDRLHAKAEAYDEVMKKLDAATQFTMFRQTSDAVDAIFEEERKTGRYVP